MTMIQPNGAMMLSPGQNDYLDTMIPNGWARRQDLPVKIFDDGGRLSCWILPEEAIAQIRTDPGQWVVQVVQDPNGGLSLSIVSIHQGVGHA